MADTEVEKWVSLVEMLAAVSRKYPQTAVYAGFSMMCLQAEWQYICHTTPRVAAAMAPVKNSIREVFLPCLFGGSMVVQITDEWRSLLTHSVKQAAGLGIRNPVAAGDRLYQASKEVNTELVSSLLTSSCLDLVDHVKCVHDSSKKARDERVEKEIAEVKALGRKQGKHCIV